MFIKIKSKLIHIMTKNLCLSSLNNVQALKVRESRNRPGVAQRVPGGLGSQIFMTLCT